MATNNKKIEEEVVTYPSLSSKTLKELIEFKESVKFLIDYYENLARANMGNYGHDAVEICYSAKQKIDKYTNGYNRIIAEIENKINQNLFL